MSAHPDVHRGGQLLPDPSKLPQLQTVEVPHRVEPPGGGLPGEGFGGPPPGWSETERGSDLQEASNLRAAWNYTPRPYPGPAVLWGPRILQIVDVPGDHYTLLQRPHVEALASHLRRLLEGEVPAR